MSSPHPLPARTSAALLREARSQLQGDAEIAPGLIDEALRRSWQRSRGFGLAPTGRNAGGPHASAAQLARALDRQAELVSHARPVVEFLFEQTRGSEGVVILADAQGVLLQALGDAGFLDRAQRVALRPGACWHERWRGTNAVGTALAEGAPVVVRGAEHYLERNGFLACTAAPIFDPAGQVLGVLDISGDHRGHHRHTLALVRSAARMIEHRLFDTRHAAALRLRLHAQPQGIGSVAEGLLALAGDGRLAGANAQALSMLGLGFDAIGSHAALQCLQLELPALWARSRIGVPQALRREDGSLLWMRVEAGGELPAASVFGVAPAAPPVPHDALSELDAGDGAMQSAIGRARRVLDKPIALLLQGESGAGKEVFARAVHASGRRHDRPFVAVNCAALPESLIEAELFGYRAGAFTGAARDGAPGRIREAHGGTLFLDEIGDMPLPLQARLLRVLQDHEVQPLGGGKPVPVDFRLICATHRNLRVQMERGRFREDLYYRLNGLALHLPPLRERQDLGELVARMLAQLQPQRTPRLAPELEAAFARHRWPGNLRQLHNALRTACALLDEGEPQIGWAHLPDDLAEDLRSAPMPRAAADEAADLRVQSERTVRQIVQACAGNLSEAARRLGISRNTLYRKMRQLGLTLPR
ncbi:MAG: sigma-54-dependent Fis family transcriptional regulator [Aquabacterium sp.]|nr:MAG: sigma-54-dependent Fis family transcriptional regulator [Aquabacterium sp.]